LAGDFARSKNWAFYSSRTNIRDILADCVVPFAPFLGPELMQDNARPNTAENV
jgi:hypothetical protein